MPDLLSRFLQAFIPLFVAIDAIGLAALYLGISDHMPVERREKIARQALWTAAGVSLLFLFLGQAIFRALSITENDFQVAGGLILLILAVREMVQQTHHKTKNLSEDFGVVPLGMPLIAGPAMLASLLVSYQSVGLVITLVALAVNLALVVVAFRTSDRLGRWIGLTGMRAISKIISLLLAAIAVAMIRKGLGR
ncbi:MarC family protein [Nibricoccus sp. IMCC34717]|uniref:MarC family protein n=1 Tax=Nibricoccus sp. IMCC34717 TaxID=3034021 RepID=UPI00384C20D6